MEENPYSSPAPYAPEPLPPPADFRDQSVGLKIFGGLQIVLGGFLGLGTVAAAVGMAAVMAGGGKSDWQQLAGGLLMNVVLVVGLVGLGVGSIWARRWARALTLIGAWLTLVVGTASSVFTLLRLPAMSQGNPGLDKMPPEALLVMTVVAGGILLVLFIGLPLAFLLFYRRPSVRATCEWRNPQTCWTDRCPLPVLAVSVVLGYGLLMVPGNVAMGCVVPLFGQWVSGPLGGLILLCVALASGYLAWGTYRLRPSAWWGTLLLAITISTSSLLTYANADLLEMYRKMGLPPEQIAMIEKMGMSGWLSVGAPQMLYVAATMAYLFYVRRYFFPSERPS